MTAVSPSTRMSTLAVVDVPANDIRPIDYLAAIVHMSRPAHTVLVELGLDALRTLEDRCGNNTSPRYVNNSTRNHNTPFRNK